MIIRFLTQNDIVEHDKVSSQAFVIPCDIHDKSSVLPSEKVLGAFDDDNKTLFADFEILEKKCNYEGKLLTCAAIGGVAAKPEHRGKGAVKALFHHLFNRMDYDISILYPFSEEYYRKLGYERAGASVSADIPFSEISKIKKNNDVTLYEGQNTQALLALYNRCAKSYTLSFVRDNAAAFSNQPYFSNKYTYIWRNNSFATFSVDRKANSVQVQEIYYDSCESMLGIIGFLRNFESNQKQLCFQKIPVNSPIFNYVSDLKNCTIKAYNTGAVRILNFKSVLEAHRYPAQDGAFTLQIGKKIFKVQYSKNSVKVEDGNIHDPDVIMDIGTASKILLGGIENAEYIPNLIIKHSESDFFKSFAPKAPFFTDGF